MKTETNEKNKKGLFIEWNEINEVPCSNEAMGATCIKDLCHHFKGDQISDKSDECSGRFPVSRNPDKI